MDPDVHGIDMFPQACQKTIRTRLAQYKFIELFLSCLPVNCTLSTCSYQNMNDFYNFISL